MQRPPTLTLPPKGGGNKKKRWLALVAVLGATSAHSQETDSPRVDPSVTPAQFTQPIGVVPAPAAVASGVVSDPPTPVVRVQVRVPANVAPGKDVTYKIVVANTSQAHAYRVTVRNPIPETAQFVRAEPKPDKPEAAREVRWTIGMLRAGERREIELVLKPTAEAKEVRNQAFVSYEHGQAVVTQVNKPKLAVTKVAPKQAAQSDPIPVRVVIENRGRVSVDKVELVEEVTKGFEFAADAEGEKGTSPQQRIWRLGTLRPGERKVVEYKLTAKEAAELLTTSFVKSQETPEAEQAQSTTKVLTAALTLDLTGPQTVGGGEPALYEIVARNTGTLPLANVRVSGSVPGDCTLTKMTNGGQRYRDQVAWTIPQLKPGEAQSFRLGLRANTTGQRTVRAAASARGLEKAREQRTSFQGTALLQWHAVLDPQVSTGQQRVLTLRVENRGGEAAKNVRLRVELPQQVSVHQATPRNRSSANLVEFDAVSVPANGEETFTITYQAERSGQAYFVMKLWADTLGEQPLVKEQAVEITGGR
ncbi:MAG TPA: hypothetical protein VFG68_09235 [Fimbriiglobus sp.]|nr:hypothetical protein [Fimbriiglobus sp.]